MTNPISGSNRGVPEHETACRDEGTVVILAGKPPRPGSIIGELSRELVVKGLQVSVELPHDTGIEKVMHCPRDALFVHRGLCRSILNDLHVLEQNGLRFCNPVAASLLAQNRSTLLARLHAEGIAAPSYTTHESWTCARASANERGGVLKSAGGAKGRGAGVLFADRSTLPIDAPFEGPYIVENFVHNDGMDRKLYVAGQACFGLLKPWPRDAGKPVAFEPSKELREIARKVGRISGLSIFGVDLVLGNKGAVVVDVNVFPGFRCIPGAAHHVARYIIERIA